MTRIYTIRSGDTINGIAAAHNTSVKKLLKLNPQVDDPNAIFVGEPINVPSDGPGWAGAAAAAGAVEPGWYGIAERELGETEIRGSDHNPRIIEYHATTTLAATTDEVPWCSSFVNWCFKQVHTEGTRSAAARSWLRWGKSLTEPRKGCVVVFSSSRGPRSGHVGFFERLSGNHIVVLGGNQANSVNLSSYPMSRLLGYRWPS